MKTDVLHARINLVNKFLIISLLSRSEVIIEEQYIHPSVKANEDSKDTVIVILLIIF